MDELLSFINKPTERKYELIKVAQAHHRFSWIHPFDNGNGRVVRLFTYAMLLHFGFDVKAQGRILNPTAVFCVNRDEYYNMLSHGDKGTPRGLNRWCEYVLAGLQIELQHINKLADYAFLKANIIMPALNKALQQGVINKLQHAILGFGIENGELKRNLLLEDIKLSPNQMTYQLAKLIEKGLISLVRENSRSYVPNINKSLITRWVIQALYEQGFMERIA